MLIDDYCPVIVVGEYESFIEVLATFKRQVLFHLPMLFHHPLFPSPLQGKKWVWVISSDCQKYVKSSGQQCPKPNGCCRGPLLGFLKSKEIRVSSLLLVGAGGFASMRRGGAEASGLW